MEPTPFEGIAAKHIGSMKFSTEAIVAFAVAVVFALLSLGAIAREQGQEPTRARHPTYIATNSVNLSQIAASETDVIGFY
jgi:phage-related minor tail protein